MHAIRLLNKRNKTDTYPADLIIFDIDRTDVVMGNPIHLEDKDDDDERAGVLQEYRRYFTTEMDENGVFAKRVDYFTSLVKDGKKIALRCWCHPKQCHGDVIIEYIHKTLGIGMAEKSDKEKYTFLEDPHKDKDIDYVECRHVIHMPKRDGRFDWHMVKEVIHFKDGTSTPNVRYLKEFKQKYWVTAPHLRATHTQKKEWEYLDKLIERESTASDLPQSIAMSLGLMRYANQPHRLRDSPHLYGTDVPSTVSIKYNYMKAFKGKKETPYTVAYSDTETNMLGIEEGRSKHIIMQSLFFDGKLYTVILEDFLKTVPRPQETLRQLYDEFMPEQGKPLVKEWEVELVAHPIDIVKRILKRCHTWQPDFLSFWNMIFDLDKMIECVEEAGYRVEDIFCDPRLPPQLRYAFLKRANPSKTSASGRQMTKKPADQWHSFLCPASFYVIDQMATYRFIRKTKQLEPSYGLDEILGKELKGLGKLKFKAAEGMNKAEFHIFMQQNYPGEYTIYHVWDAVCMHLLTEKTKDLSFSLPGTTEYSDFISFESEPKRYIHKFHHYILEKHNAVTGVGGKSLVQEFDSMTISGKDHIVTLQPHLTIETGLNIFKDYPGLQSNFYAHNADLDVKSSYPYGQWGFNMSRQTTVREVIEIVGIRDEVRRIQGLNLSGGRSNAIEFSTQIFGVPTLSELSKIYDAQVIDT